MGRRTGTALLGRWRAPFIRIVLVITSLLFLSMVTLLYYKSSTTAEPKSVVMVQGAENLKGAVVTVEGLSLKTPYKLPLLEEHRYAARFFLQPGYYTLTVRFEEKGEEVFRRELVVVENQGYRIDLTPKKSEKPLLPL